MLEKLKLQAGRNRTSELFECIKVENDYTPEQLRKIEEIKELIFLYYFST